MPQPHIHYLITYYSIRGEAPHLLRYMNFAGNASFDPDAEYLLGVPHVLTHFPKVNQLLSSRLPPEVYRMIPGAKSFPGVNHRFISDIKHWEGSRDYAVHGLQYIKDNTEPGSEKRNKLLADLIGYVGHVVTDRFYHALVNFLADDHWKLHTVRTFGEHKGIETDIDAGALGRLGKNPFTFGLSFRIKCHADDSGRTLDPDIIGFIEEVMEKTYRGILADYGLDYDDFFPQNGTVKNPVLEAYKDKISCFRFLWDYGIAKAMPRRVNVLVPVTAFKVEELQELDPLPPVEELQQELKGLEARLGAAMSLGAPSFRDLFNASVFSLQRIVKAFDGYLSSSERSAEAYLSEHCSDIIGLEQNWNFDIGLPSARNGEILEIDKEYGVQSSKMSQIDMPHVEIPSTAVITKIALEQLIRDFDQTKIESLRQRDLWRV